MFYLFPLRNLEWIILTEALCFHGFSTKNQAMLPSVTSRVN